jgi:hypothetical protein
LADLTGLRVWFASQVGFGIVLNRLLVRLEAGTVLRMLPEFTAKLFVEGPRIRRDAVGEAIPPGDMILCEPFSPPVLLQQFLPRRFGGFLPGVLKDLIPARLWDPLPVVRRSGGC